MTDEAGLLEKNSNNGVCHIFLFKFHPLSNNPEAILFVLGAWIDV